MLKHHCPALMTLHIDYYQVHLSGLKNFKLLSYLAETYATRRISSPLLWSFHPSLRIASNRSHVICHIKDITMFTSNTIYFLLQSSRLPLILHQDFGLGVNLLHLPLFIKKIPQISLNSFISSFQNANFKDPGMRTLFLLLNNIQHCSLLLPRYLCHLFHTVNSLGTHIHITCSKTTFQFITRHLSITSTSTNSSNRKNNY